MYQDDEQTIRFLNGQLDEILSEQAASRRRQSVEFLTRHNLGDNDPFERFEIEAASLRGGNVNGQYQR
jgi:hypothetical protein